METIDIKNLFKNSQQITDCRLIKNKNGQSKGFAYVDFSDHDSAQKGLELNGQIVQGNQIQVALSKPPKYTHNKPTIFVNNLPFSITKQELLESLNEFQQSITEIRIIEQNGKSKGYAYVEMDNQENMKGLIQRYKGNLVIKNRKIDIEQSRQSEKEEQKRNLVLYIENLSFKVQERDLLKFFESYCIVVNQILKQIKLQQSRIREGRVEDLHMQKFKILKNIQKLLTQKEEIYMEENFLFKNLIDLYLKKNKIIFSL